MAFQDASNFGARLVLPPPHSVDRTAPAEPPQRLTRAAEGGLPALRRWLAGAPVLLLMLVSLLGMAGLAHRALRPGQAHPLPLVDLAAMAGLWACCICYLLSRYGTARRRAAAVPGLRLMTEPAGVAPHVTVLIPSYCEEPRVIRGTVLSAAMAVYSARNIVVLVDDPVHETASVARSLAAVESVRADLAGPMDHLRAAMHSWQRRRLAAPMLDLAAETARLASEFRWLADWLSAFGDRMIAEAPASFEHVDRFFVQSVLTPLERLYRAEAAALPRVAAPELVERMYARLADAFCTDITTFQRKEYANLPHAANKAMNLNAYIGLMGQSLRRRSRMKQAYLRPEPGRAHLVVRRPDYVMTLDADSLVRPGYIQDLARLLDRNPNYAVVQTPYLSFPGGSTAVERFAGATTDIQYLLHQGSTHFNASFWVGANALIRYRALQQIGQTVEQDGKPVSLFIQDRTVIEDTDSTVDLLERGWVVHNHFAPLAHSATPADFGALCIQRKRWSNGGLIIVGGLLRALWRAPRGTTGPGGAILRLYYLLSPVVGNLCLLLLMLTSQANPAVLGWMAVAVAPYFILYALDLRRMGYRIRDLFSVLSLNLMLLPVVFAGILESVVQIVTGRKTSFARTPKVEGRTGVPGLFVVFYLLLMAYMGTLAIQSLIAHDPWGAASPVLNFAMVSYGVLRFIGPGHALADMTAGFRRQAG